MSAISAAPDAAWAAAAEEFLEQVNEHFGDSLLLVGQVLGGRADAVTAIATAASPGGLTLGLTDADGTVAEVFLAFDARADDAERLGDASFALLLRARAESGEDGATSAEREAEMLASREVYVTTVASAEDLHPHLRRITFRGGDLARFAPLGPDTYVRVLLPPVGRTELSVGRDFCWDAVLALPPAERPVHAYYTVRAWRPEVQELDVLFVLHGDDGPASTWAAGAQPGDPVALWGPLEGWSPPADTEWHLLVVDDTGLPAAAAIVESLPPDARVLVIAEVDNPDERQPLPDHPGVAVTWCYRDGAAPGTTSLLVDALRAADLPAGLPYVWGGAESRAMTATRTYLRGERGLPRERVLLVGYWRYA